MAAKPMGRTRLGVNIDHVATVRNARGGLHPDPVRAAHLVAVAGGDQITAHLREDRRHIKDADIERLMAEVSLPLNMEMAATDEMLAIALRHRPFAICIVPERRAELTTEGGLDAVGGRKILAPIIAALADAGCRVALFLDADPRQIEAAHALGAQAVELHTGAYAHATMSGSASGVPAGSITDHLRLLADAAAFGTELGLEMHAGHGLDYANVGPVAQIPRIMELNIGHHLVGEALFVGFEAAIRRMRRTIDEAIDEVPENDGNGIGMHVDEAR
ncbi:pyridoxine 5'-phosphate synthase [Iodidimonas nitroreducens]|uniref:Pyridoxine 5'-phosphate synthase n=1 Tax=Iodidimonas nitroreducens TaxID=1236968 RepID=A0A5A7N6J5_9PROT|nr:pyridoxine 5'-phosphate synthase [Iodidimonas nitroreducens]GAK33850.1 pyridoxine 5'-phosphate synthase [alpha proteobacterium Q-1]GER03265.1 pyridoxine 5'-phosphate synthase [Iodidimonas nitroreducens]